ncbi:hypothetical protein FSARC_539 [Fusarium sarcochroum]|uniref:ribonuclease H n=1 Tax=Fusarium sarcochroum TaxID=1208366 RepID=A0A8H4UAU4_9HYPO|nr:hypothetical protein FSARC_539 [Fusarium sarcochroum]
MLPESSDRGLRATRHWSRQITIEFDDMIIYYCLVGFLLTTHTTVDPGSSISSSDYADYLDQHDAEMNKKRGAPADGAGAGSSSKMRKMENAKKYYAVKAGRNPGIYVDYEDCKAQISGFSGAVFKSFKTQQEAQDFVDGKRVQSAANGPTKFYALAVGKQPGIYEDWGEVQSRIIGVSGPKYMKFSTRGDAEDYIREKGTQETCDALGLGSKAEPTQQYTGAAFEPVKETKPDSIQEPNPTAPKPGPDGDILKVYTDGSSLGNGQAGSRAGLGVFFGIDDKRNLAERLPGEPQTNQRAELLAMLRALEIVPLTQGVQIWSDSQYSIKCVTLWAPSWQKRNWRTSGGGEVKNQDIIRNLLAKVKERTDAGTTTTFQWVKGHSTDKGNQGADNLANIGSRMPPV